MRCVHGDLAGADDLAAERRRFPAVDSIAAAIGASCEIHAVPHGEAEPALTRTHTRLRYDRATAGWLHTLLWP
jgi:hypothetical protein